MVSNMNIEPRAEICDSNRPILTHSAISQHSIEFQMSQQNNSIEIAPTATTMDTAELTKKVLKLQLSQRSGDTTEKGSIDLDEKSATVTTAAAAVAAASNASNLEEIKSPKSPLSNSSRSGGSCGGGVSGPGAINASGGVSGRSTISHQSSITSQIDVVEDRKALRDALYQGIFHRHRRTIFAVGSFLRMLRTRNSQYNTIRSSSEGDEDTR